MMMNEKLKAKYVCKKIGALSGLIYSNKKIIAGVLLLKSASDQAS
jgi:hypothetical protein